VDWPGDCLFNEGLTMKLYYHPLSQHARRVRVLCYELGLRPELVPVAIEKGENRSADFLRLSAAHAIPVMDDDGFVLAESHAIMRYLCAQHAGESFYPQDVRQRALVDQWLDWNHCKLNPPIQTLTIQTMFMGPKADPQVIQASRQDAAEALEVLETGLADERGIGTRQVNLADIAIATTLGLYVACKGSFEAAPRALSWYADIDQRPSFVATRPQ
jgi:glutathione S-transferase